MAKKYKKVKIKASNGLALRNGPNILGDVFGAVLNEDEYTVEETAKDGHFLWGYLKEAGGWVLLENYKTGAVNVVAVKPPKRVKRQAPKKVAVQQESPLEPLPEVLLDPAATEIADEEN